MRGTNVVGDDVASNTNYVYTIYNEVYKIYVLLTRISNLHI